MEDRTLNKFQQEEVLDIRELQKWNCIIEPALSPSVRQIGGLYLADIDCAQDPILLQQLNIGALLSVIDEPQVRLPTYMNYMSREIISIPDCAQESIIHYLPRCFDFIDKHRSQTNVMVHCFAGISRSATVVIAYIMQKFDWDFQKTLQTVKAVRKQVKPNHGFVQQLFQYEQFLKANKSKKSESNINRNNNYYYKDQSPEQVRQRYSQQIRPATSAQKAYDDNKNILQTQSAKKPERNISSAFKDPRELKKISVPGLVNQKPLNKVLKAIDNQSKLYKNIPTFPVNMYQDFKQFQSEKYQQSLTRHTHQQRHSEYQYQKILQNMGQQQEDKIISPIIELQNNFQMYKLKRDSQDNEIKSSNVYGQYFRENKYTPSLLQNGRFPSAQRITPQKLYNNNYYQQ